MHIKNTPNEKLDKFFFLPKNDDRRGEGGLRTKGFNKKTEYNKPLISIITVSYNSSSTIEDTIKSVLILPYKNIDYIIIDGGSDDTTVEKIKKYDNQINYWISESDNGIYDAMNEDKLKANELHFLKNGRLFREKDYKEDYTLVMYHNRKGKPIISFFKYKIKELLFKINLYNGNIR